MPVPLPWFISQRSTIHEIDLDCNPDLTVNNPKKFVGNCDIELPEFFFLDNGVKNYQAEKIIRRTLPNNNK